MSSMSEVIETLKRTLPQFKFILLKPMPLKCLMTLAKAQAKQNNVILFIENTPQTNRMIRILLADQTIPTDPWFVMFEKESIAFGSRNWSVATAINSIRMLVTKERQFECCICLESLDDEKDTSACFRCASVVCLSCREQIVNEEGRYLCPVCREKQSAVKVEKVSSPPNIQSDYF